MYVSFLLIWFMAFVVEVKVVFFFFELLVSFSADVIIHLDGASNE